MKRTIITVFITIAALFVSSGIYAEDQIKVAVDADTHTVGVSGDKGTDKADKRIMITVRPGNTIDSEAPAITPENIKENIIGLFMAYTDSDGKFKTEFPINAPDGDYTVTVYGPENGEKESVLIYLANDVSSILAQLEEGRKEKNSSLIKEILDDEASFRSLGLGKHDDKTYTVKYTDLDSSSFNILANYPEGYNSAKDFLQAYREVCTVKIFNSFKSADEVLPAVKLCDDILGITSDEAYDLYKDLKDSSDVDRSLTGGGFKSASEITERFKNSVYLCAVSSMQNWSEFSGFLKKNNSKIGLDLTDYDKLSAPQNVDKAIAGKTYGSLDDLKAAFIKAVKEEIKAEKNDNSSQGSGGGGGRSGSGTSGGVAAIPSATVRTDPINDSDTPDTNETVFNEGFIDLDNVLWAKEAIEYLAKRSVINGKGDRKFFPNDLLMREECAKILVNAFGIGKEGTSCSFTDLDDAHWSYEYVAAAENAGIIKGYEDGSFGIGRGISRQELAVMIYRILSFGKTELTKEKQVEFTDVGEIMPWAKDAVEALSGAGIINGKEDSRFAPNDKCTRAEAAKMIYEVLIRSGQR